MGRRWSGQQTTIGSGGGEACEEDGFNLAQAAKGIKYWWALLPLWPNPQVPFPSVGFGLLENLFFINGSSRSPLFTPRITAA